MGKDSNLRSANAADLQSASFGRLGHPSMGGPLGRIRTLNNWGYNPVPLPTRASSGCDD